MNSKKKPQQDTPTDEIGLGKNLHRIFTEHGIYTRQQVASLFKDHFQDTYKIKGLGERWQITVIEELKKSGDLPQDFIPDYTLPELHPEWGVPKFWLRKLRAIGINKKADLIKALKNDSAKITTTLGTARRYIIIDLLKKSGDLAVDFRITSASSAGITDDVSVDTALRFNGVPNLAVTLDLVNNDFQVFYGLKNFGKTRLLKLINFLKAHHYIASDFQIPLRDPNHPYSYARVRDSIRKATQRYEANQPG